ncbi:MAG: hypothetical protein J6B29_05105 [Clostridia bacterium]|nr:hypothetical protein [Clostridia bacterium]
MKALVSSLISDKIKKVLDSDVISLPPYEKLDAPVSTHPDMLFFSIGRTVFCYEDYVKEQGIDKELISAGYNIVYTDSVCHKQYPNDIALNVLQMGNFLFCKRDSMSSQILEYSEQNDMSIINVKQGYTACSTLALDENHAITADVGIARAIESTGKSVLLIKGDGILLDGYSCGFIGGASFVFGDTVFFFGDITTISDGRKITDYLEQNGYKYKSIFSGRVCDFGGVKLL